MNLKHLMKEFNQNFHELFFKREIKPLSGRKFSNLLILVFMLFIAFTVIGFAEGSLRYLEQKMKDPFINWVNVIPQPHKGIPIQRVLEELNSEQIKEEYYLQNAIGHNRMQYNFYQYNDINQYYETGNINNERLFAFPARTLDIEDPVMAEIFSSKNLIRGKTYDYKEDIGLTVTSDMLRELNYPAETPYIWMDFLAYQTSDMSEIRVTIPIPVRAVVKALPGLASWTATSYFQQQRGFFFEQNPFNPIDDNRMVLSFHGKFDDLEKLTNSLSKIIENKTTAPQHQMNSIWYENRPLDGTESNKYLIFINFKPRKISLQLLDEMFTEIYNHNDLNNYKSKIFRFYDYETRFRPLIPVNEYDRISLNFSNLDKLREFSILLLENYQLEVDMAHIESRENYNFISRLTRIISLVLIGFSILSILLFMTYLLKRHLESIRRNLGTFKAFGLSNHFLTSVYVKIVLTILSVAILSALILSAIFGYAGGMRLILYLFGARIESGIYFSLISYHLILAILALIVFSILVLRKVSNRILSQTPGDLIYERE